MGETNLQIIVRWPNRDIFLQSSKIPWQRESNANTNGLLKTLPSEGRQLADALACPCRRLNHGIQPPLCWRFQLVRSKGNDCPDLLVVACARKDQRLAGSE